MLVCGVGYIRFYWTLAWFLEYFNGRCCVIVVSLLVVEAGF